jgi:hypothetical protein
MDFVCGFFCFYDHGISISKVRYFHFGVENFQKSHKKQGSQGDTTNSESLIEGWEFPTTLFIKEPQYSGVFLSIFQAIQFAIARKF